MKQIRFACIGMGSIARTHLLGAFDANLRMDVDYALVPAAVLTRSPVDTKIEGLLNYQDFDRMLAIEQLDYIDICTPNDTHLAYVEKASAAGMPIYCEKPLAHDYETACRMTELVDRSGVPNAVAFMYRFLPSINLLKTQLAEEVIGPIINFRLATFHSGYLSSAKTGWRLSAASGGGALLDIGVHLIDLVHYVLGDIVEVDAEATTYFKARSAVDDHAFCRVRLDTGVCGTIEVSRISAESDSRDYVEVFGEKGSLKVFMKKPYTTEYFNAESSCTILVYAPESLLKQLHFPGERSALGFFQSAHTSSLLGFADAVCYGTKSAVAASFADGQKAQWVIQQAYHQ